MNKLFDDNEFHANQNEWKDMPEFNMNPEIPLLTIKISFKNQSDIDEFSELIKQKIYFKRENYWFPKLNRNAFSDLCYHDSEINTHGSTGT